MDKIKVAVIGIGHLGQHHARIFSQNPRCELVAVVDKKGSNARRTAKQLGCEGYKHYSRILDKERVHAVSIAAPTPLHHEIASQFLELGIHCMVEKPITTTVEDAEDLIRISEEKDAILQVGHIEHYNAALRKLSEILEKPGFIECHRLGPFVARAASVGVVLDLMIHDIDIVLQIVDSPLVSMDAVGVSVLTDKEDIANVRLKFENGCTANLTASRVSPKPRRKIRVFQNDCYVSIDCAKQSMEIYRREALPDAGEGEPQARIVRKRLRLKKEDMLTLELDDFITAVVDGRTPKVTGHHARDALHVAVEIARMIKEQNLEKKFQ